MSRARLWFLLNSLAPYGAETFVLRHAIHADRARFAVTVCQLGGPTTLAPQFEAAGIPVVNLHAHGRLDVTALARLAWRLRAERVDVLQTHIGYASAVGRMIGRMAGVRAIVSTEQSVRDDHDYSPWLRRAMDATFRLAHARVFISAAVRASFRARFPDDDGPIIANGIDARRIAGIAHAARAEVRAELGLGENDFAFGCVARLNPRKGQALAIDALPAGAHLVLVGDGEDRASLAARARGMNVHSVGQRLDVARLLGAFDAYVHPALVEGLGIAVLEAMAVGLPTIASDTGGIPEFVHDGETGWLCPPGDVKALAARMAAVRDNPRPDIAAAGQKLVLERYDIRASVRAYEQLYDRLLGRQQLNNELPGGHQMSGVERSW